MAFSEATKLAVKRKAHLSCCLCKALGVEVHHIVPQAQQGDDTEDNAAPLCPSCHETYGANPEKRKFIREARDLWYEICAKRYTSDPDRLSEVLEKLETAATKADLEEATAKLIEVMRTVAAENDRPIKERSQEIAHLGAMIAPGVSANRHCKRCGTTIGLFVGDQGRCPECGAPW